MFENLSTKLDSIFKKLRGHGKLTEENIQEALKEVRMALLEADVNFKVVKDFIQQVQGRAVGQEVGRDDLPDGRRGGEDPSFGKSSRSHYAGRSPWMWENNHGRETRAIF